MSVVMTYDSLGAQLKNWLERFADAQFIDQIPTIISQAESMISQEYKGLGLQTSVIAEFTPGISSYPKPVRWRESISISYGQGATSAETGTKRVFLKKRDIEFCRSVWPDPTVTDADFNPPEFYSEYTWGYFYVAPTPALAYPFEFMFYERVPPLGPNMATNWLTEQAPDMLFKACIYWAGRYLRRMEEYEVLQGDYNRALQASMGENVARISDAAQEAKQGI